MDDDGGAVAAAETKDRHTGLVGYMEYLISVHSALQAYVLRRFSETHEKFARFDASGAWQTMTSEVRVFAVTMSDRC